MDPAIEYAHTLAVHLGLDLCECSTTRCASCLNCTGLHCLCAANGLIARLGTQVSVSAETLALAYIDSNPNSKPPQVQQQQLCSICSSSAGTHAVVRCKHCANLFHCACLEILPERLPEGAWFCNSCFPLGQHIYYPYAKITMPTIMEKARVAQICAGEAKKIPAKVQVRIVENFVKKMSMNTGEKLLPIKYAAPSSK
jgi:hypothetical protein